MIARYLIGDVFERLANIPDHSVDLVMTSPPFLALRSYLPDGHPDKAKEIGSEPTPAEFLDTMLALTAEWRRVLAPHGSICVELGDTYAGSGGGGGDYLPGGLREDQPGFGGSAAKAREGNAAHWRQKNQQRDAWPLDKSLTGIPTLYAWSLAYGRNLIYEPFSARELLEWIDGLRTAGLTAEAALAMAGGWVAEHGRPQRFAPWRIRNLVAWVRPNPPVGALGDKFRPATSYLTVATIARDRWFDLDAVRTPSHDTRPRNTNGPKSVDAASEVQVKYDTRTTNPAGAPPLDWWEIPPGGYSGAHYACVDDQTEALTPTGWKRHEALRDGDLIAAYDPHSATWSFQPATFHRYPYAGDLVTIDKRVTNQRLTPNHRVLMATRKDPTPRVREADALTPGCRLPVAAEMADGGVGPGAKAAALAGWFCTEGHIGHAWPVINQSESANPAKVQEIRSLLDGLDADYAERSRTRVGITGKPSVDVSFVVKGPLAEWLRQFHKSLSMSAVFGWSTIDIRALFNALVDGDGHRRADGRMSFVQRDRPVAEAFQMIATRLGYRTTLTQRPASRIWQVHVSPGRWVDLRQGENGNRSAVGRERYDGTVWCPSVPSSFWVARRNGQPFITGNTYPPELCRRPIDAMCPRRVCTTCGTPSRRLTKPSDAHAERQNASRGKWVSGIAEGKGAHDIKPAAGRVAAEYLTTGWSSCGCPGTDGIRLDGFHIGTGWRPGHVLDPFGGSGTTALVATGLGRTCTLIDIDERNAELARQRLGMFLTDVDAAPAEGA